ncbi:MAG: hypothetical protein MUF47_06070, partial [Porphyrobacter sp.]|nr:hypothetical protein [Porphyrobacter sp.]
MPIGLDMPGSGSTPLRCRCTRLNHKISCHRRVESICFKTLLVQPRNRGLAHGVGKTRMITQQAANANFHGLRKPREVAFHERPVTRHAQSIGGHALPEALKHREVVLG